VDLQCVKEVTMVTTVGRPRLGGTMARRAAAVRAVEVRDWRGYAACRGTAALFYKTDLEEAPEHRITKAKAICTRCPVRPQCAAYALAVAEPHGIWGGFTERERELLLATDWRQWADRRCTQVDVAGLQARLRAIRSAVPEAMCEP
jgi:WhiB family redox-sensing transcriptional regulator